jgi:transcriptional regulator
MYVPSCFEEPERALLIDFIRTHPFAILVCTRSDGTLLASHIPLEVQPAAAGGEILIGHLAAANEQWHSLRGDREALAIFQGPNSYITPRWYDHVNVPTWNYIAVHVYGIPTVTREPDALREIVGRQVDKHEAGAAVPYRIDTLPPEYLAKELCGIVGITIPVSRLEASFKLSQNRHARDYRNIVTELEARPDDQSRQVAEWMKTRCPVKE